MAKSLFVAYNYTLFSSKCTEAAPHPPPTHCRPTAYLLPPFYLPTNDALHPLTTGVAVTSLVVDHGLSKVREVDRVEARG